MATMEQRTLKSGWLTTEFLLTALVLVGVFVLLLTGRISVDQLAEMWPIFASSGGYALSRGIAKTASR